MPEKVGRYRILSELGRGSMGTVYRAEDTLILRVVALKCVARPGPQSAPAEHDAFARFVREAHAAGKLAHPSVVTVFDVGEDEATGLSYIAMELIEGTPLDAVLRERRSLDYAQIRSIGREVASALEHAHRAGVVHRDIKPANLILTAAGSVKVTDFGIAKMVDAAMTQDGALLGSPGYMSPEQIRSSTVDHRTDLFSLGVVLYELVTLTPAFPGKNVFEVIHQVMKGDLKLPSEIRPDCPPDLERAIVRATAKAREKRFESAAEMGAAIEDKAPAPAPAIPRGAVVVDVIADDVATGARGAEAPADAPGEAAVAPARAGRKGRSETTQVMPLKEAKRVERTAQGRPPAWVAAAAGSVGLAALLGAVLFLRKGREEAPVADPGVAAAAAQARLAAGRPGDDDVSRRAVAETVPASVSEAGSEDAPGAAPDDRASGAAPPGAPAERRPAPAVRREPPGDTRTAAEAEPPAGDGTAVAAPSAPARPRFLYTVPAEHRHRIGSCHGTLKVFADRMVYDSTDQDRDDRTWTWADLKRARIADDEVELVADEKEATTLALRAKRYNFRLERPLAREARALIEARTGG